MNPIELVSLLKPETERIDKTMHADLADINNQLLREVIHYAIFNGGKRVRPLLTVLSARLCQPDLPALSETTENLYRFSLSFEYLHAASLLHDDVIDRAEKRRGHRTANTVWDNTHVILAGDFLHARALFLAGTLGNSGALARISKATEAMVTSEFIQLENATTLDTSEDNYYKVLQGKTAALISAACETGALVSCGKEEHGTALRLFGTNLGLTFQIVDDLLDYLGDPAKTGKAVGNDFQERKMTLPLIFALTNANVSERKSLFTLLESDSESRAAATQEAREIIEESGGFTYARQKAEALTTEAVNALSIFADGPEKSIMAALCQYVLEREK